MPSPRGLVQRMDRELHRSGLLPRGARLLVGVSGGADSVAMLRLLADLNGSAYWDWTLVVGHVEHGIRGAASRADAAFTKELAAGLGLPFAMRRLKLGKNASEASARAGRLRALRSLVKEHRCAGVVLAHHADDQAETVLLRLLRGAGLEGLAGMAPQREVEGLTLFRPLLSVRREVLHGYLRSLRQPWREDATNSTGAYLRNRVRAELMPAVEALAPGAVEALGRTAVLAGETQAFVAGHVEALLAQAERPVGRGRVVLCRRTLRKADRVVCGEALRAVVMRAGGSVEAAGFERIREALYIVQGEQGGKAVEMGRGVRLRVMGDEVVVERERPRR